MDIIKSTISDVKALHKRQLLLQGINLGEQQLHLVSYHTRCSWGLHSTVAIPVMMLLSAVSVSASQILVYCNSNLFPMHLQA